MELKEVMNISSSIRSYTGRKIPDAHRFKTNEEKYYGRSDADNYYNY